MFWNIKWTLSEEKTNTIKGKNKNGISYLEKNGKLEKMSFYSLNY